MKISYKNIYMYIYIYIYIYIYEYLGFPLRPFANHWTAAEEEGHFFNSSLPLSLASQTF